LRKYIRRQAAHAAKLSNIQVIHGFSSQENESLENILRGAILSKKFSKSIDRARK
jgi:hypothetical protein